MHAADTSNIVTGDMTTLCIPPEDGSIEQGFIEVDEKLCAWFAAMRRAEDLARELSAATSQIVVEEPPVDSAEAVTPEPTPTEAAPTEADLAEPAPPEPAPPEAELPEAGLPEGELPEAELPEAELPEPEPTPPATDHAELESAVVSDDASVDPDEPVEPETPPAPTSTEPEDDGEALLDSLDPALAQMIRVLHRLNPGRSWRELIQQHQDKGKATMTPATGRRSWWRRSR